LCDALLGASALGDIGKHFPDSDPAYADAASTTLLAHVRALLERQGYRVSNADITVIAEAPRLAPHIASMRANIAGVLGVGADAVSVKATTTEGLGLVGRREGLAAHAVAVIESSD
jgi:2-C-methyl-D-erythritol 2,4-cyclodiphosphate synthase